MQEIKSEQHFTQPPPRFTEASLVKLLEEKYWSSQYLCPIIDTILRRNYVERQNKTCPYRIGNNCSDLFKRKPPMWWSGIHAQMEEELDQIAEGNME